MPQLFTNNAIALLNFGISDSDLILRVQPGLGDLFPQPVNADDYFLVTVEDYPVTRREIVKVIGRSGDVFTIGGRGQEGTVAQSWPADVLVDHRITAATLAAANEHYVLGRTGIVNSVGSTTVIDVFPTSTINRTCKWLITAIDQTLNLVSAQEVLAISRGPLGAPSFSRYANTGDSLNIKIDVVQVGPNLQLTIKNNTANVLTINALRIQHTIII